MKRTNKTEAETPQPRPARRRNAGKPRGSDFTLKLNRDGEWMGSDELRTSLLSLLAARNGAVLDLAGLTHVDAGCFQVLVSAAGSGLFAGDKVRMVNVSQHVRQCFQLAGAEALLPVTKEPAHG